MSDKDKLVQKYVKGMQKHTRKQQLRDARRKSGPQASEKKSRAKKLNPNNFDDWEDWEEMEFENVEPILSRDVRERRKEIEKSLNGGANGNSKGPADPQKTETAPNSSASRPSLVVEVSAGMCRVEQDGQILLCSLRDASLETQESGYTNVIAVGDEVRVTPLGEGQGVVEAILPRRSVLARPYSPDQGVVLADMQQIVVANVDRLLIVAAWREPNLWPALIDRYLIAAQRNHIEAVICINKVDLIEDQAEFEAIIQPYQALGHPLLRTSTVTGAGIEQLRQLLDSGTSVLAGLSGVGKSSLLTAVQPSLNLKVGGVSEHGLFAGQGRHTTTQSSLWKLKNGGVVIDTPGVRSFGVAGIAPGELAAWYPEMMPLLGKCRFNNCTHIAEPDCAIQAAAANGEISALRYKNYTQIYEELASL